MDVALKHFLIILKDMNFPMVILFHPRKIFISSILIPLQNFPEKLILSLDSFIFDIDIISCKSQKVTSEDIL